MFSVDDVIMHYNDKVVPEDHCIFMVVIRIREVDLITIVFYTQEHMYNAQVVHIFWKIQSSLLP